ncbi:MAG: ion transporter [Burkholderiaceae bacterium]|jgi:hypothetical protein
MSNDTQTMPSAPALSIRDFVYAWLFDTNNADNYQKRFDKWISILIIANLLSMFFEHVPAIYDAHKLLFHRFDQFSLAVFTVEYALRFFVAPSDPEFSGSRFPRFAYLRSPYALIDLAAISPFYLAAFIQGDLRILRVLRLLRLLKLFRILAPAIQEFRQLNVGRTFRQRVYALLNPTEYSGALQELIDNFIVWWIFISVMAVIMESVESLHYMLNLQFIILDAVAVFIFSMEYIFRLYSVVETPNFKAPWAGSAMRNHRLSSLIY